MQQHQHLDKSQNFISEIIEEIVDRICVNNRIIEMIPNRIGRDRDTLSVGLMEIPTPTVTPTVGGSGDVNPTSSSSIHVSPPPSPAYSPTSPAYSNYTLEDTLSNEIFKFEQDNIKVGEDKGVDPSSPMIDCVICTEQVERFSLYCSTCTGGICASCEETLWVKTKEKNTFPDLRNGKPGSEFVTYSCPFCNTIYPYKAEHIEFYDSLIAIHLSSIDDDVVFVGYNPQPARPRNNIGLVAAYAPGHPLGPPANPRRRAAEELPTGQPPVQRGRVRLADHDVPPNTTGISTIACVECNRQKKGCSKHLPTCVRCFRSGKLCDYNR
jgi:hypothetical protein